MARPPICCGKAIERMCQTCPRRAAAPPMMPQATWSSAIAVHGLSAAERGIARRLGPPPAGPWRPVPGKKLR